MKHVFKFILATVVLTLSFNASFADVTICLRLQGGQLIVDPNVVTVTVGDKVTWQICDPVIQSFWFQSSTGRNPFPVTLPGPTSPSPGSSYTTTANYANDPAGWVYSMGARLNKGASVISDPKIIVKPKTNPLSVIAAILITLFAALSIFLGFTVVNLRKKVKLLISQNNSSGKV